jgi:putative ABC transport system ATP-binding protein
MTAGEPRLEDVTSPFGEAAAQAAVIAAPATAQGVEISPQAATPRNTTPEETPIIGARGLGRRIQGDRWLIRGACLDLHAGDRLAITGPTGSGKTVLLRAIALLDPLDEGLVRYQGAPVHEESIPGYRKKVIYLHQRPALFRGTVADNLQRPFALQVHQGKQFDRERIRGLLEILGRGDSFLGKSSRDLSAGEAQIVALLRAIQLDPAVLLLDEPTASLDQDAARAIEGLIGRWLEEDSAARAFIWISHDPQRVRRVATRRLAMRGGQLRPEA